MPARKKKRATAAAASRGLDARRLASAAPPVSVSTLGRTIEDDGGAVLATYRDPLGGNWQIFASLPLDIVEPTPFQRDLSPAHVERVANAIDKLDRYLDPVIAVPTGEGKYWSPNGYHRLGAMRELGAKSIVALVVPEPEVARLAEALAAFDDRPEKEFATEFEEAALVTLGLCYEQNGRFSGGVYHPVLKRCDKFLGAKLPVALDTRRLRADKLLELNELVNEAVKSLKGRGLESPYLKAFVVARINPLRFQRKPNVDFDETVDKMIGSARRFDTAKIKADQVARSGGPPAAAED